MFRGKRIDNGEWIIGNLINSPDGRIAISETSGDWKLHECIPTTICQCTGLKDKNGKLIFENGIMEARLDEDYPEDVTRERVLWYGSGWYTKEQGSIDYAQLDDCDSEWYEVIGNTVDNPELLEEQE